MVGEKHTLLRAAITIRSPLVQRGRRTNTSLAIENYQGLVHRCALLSSRRERDARVSHGDVYLALSPRRICILVSDAAVAVAAAK